MKSLILLLALSFIYAFYHWQEKRQERKDSYWRGMPLTLDDLRKQRAFQQCEGCDG